MACSMYLSWWVAVSIAYVKWTCSWNDNYRVRAFRYRTETLIHATRKRLCNTPHINGMWNTLNETKETKQNDGSINHANKYSKKKTHTLAEKRNPNAVRSLRTNVYLWGTQIEGLMAVSRDNRRKYVYINGMQCVVSSASTPNGSVPAKEDISSTIYIG